MKKIALSVLIVLLLMLGVGAGVYLVRTQQDFREKAAPSSSLTLTPSKTNPKIDETFTVSANIQTGSNQVYGVEMHVTFDASKVEAIGASNSTFFTNPKNIGPSIDNTSGTLTYTVYLDPNSTPRQGQGSVAVFTFKGKSAGNTTIGLSSETAVTSTGDLGQNVLTGTNPAVLTIESSAQATSTPTPTTSSNSPTPTSLVSATPTSTSGFGNTATPTPLTVLPDTAGPLPTMFAATIGILLVVASALLAL